MSHNALPAFQVLKGRWFVGSPHIPGWWYGCDWSSTGLHVCIWICLVCQLLCPGPHKNYIRVVISCSKDTDRISSWCLVFARSCLDLESEHGRFLIEQTHEIEGCREGRLLLHGHFLSCTEFWLLAVCCSVDRWLPLRTLPQPLCTRGPRLWC